MSKCSGFGKEKELTKEAEEEQSLAGRKVRDCDVVIKKQTLEAAMTPCVRYYYWFNKDEDQRWPLALALGGHLVLCCDPHLPSLPVPPAQLTD